MRILIVKLSSIGDIVHALPTLAAIRRALPSAEVSWVVERRSAEILRGNPLLHDLIEIDTKALRRAPTFGETLLAPRWQLRRLRASVFDVSLDLQGLLKSAAVGRLARAARRYGFSRQALREPLSRFLLTETVRVPLDQHIIYKHLSLAAGALSIPVPEDPSAFEFPIAVSPDHEREAETATGPQPFAVLNPAGGWPTKLWSAERYGALADALVTRYGLRSIVTYGPGERELAERVVRASREGAARAASLSLKGFYALVRRASVYIGGDTGPTHLAVAARAPVVGIFGPTAWWRNGSPSPYDICVERTDIGCRTDCNRRSCARWVCMDVEVERVARAVGERLRRAGRAQSCA